MEGQVTSPGVADGVAKQQSIFSPFRLTLADMLLLTDIETDS